MSVYLEKTVFSTSRKILGRQVPVSNHNIFYISYEMREVAIFVNLYDHWKFYFPAVKENFI